MASISATAVDLFCGVGGLTHGLINAGINVSAGFDLDKSCEYAYEINNNTRFYKADVSTLTADDVDRLFPDGHIKVLAGCAPCQPFSTYSFRYGSNSEDHRWNLLKSFARIIRGVEPDVVSMENVPLLVRHQPFIYLLKILEKMKYQYDFRKVPCEVYGVPQKRTRLVLLASKMGKIDLIPPTHDPDDLITVRDSIGNLEKINAGESSVSDPIHKAQKLSPLNKKRIINSRPGGTWRDWDDQYICPCHKKKTGTSYDCVYGRMSWDLPSPTITTQFFNYGSGRFGHPEQDRAISLREGANLQSFPSDYIFVDPNDAVFFKKTAIHIGNAVPVKLGEAIGTSIREHL